MPGCTYDATGNIQRACISSYLGVFLSEYLRIRASVFAYLDVFVRRFLLDGLIYKKRLAKWQETATSSVTGGSIPLVTLSICLSLSLPFTTCNLVDEPGCHS